MSLSSAGQLTREGQGSRSTWVSVVPSAVAQVCGAVSLLCLAAHVTFLHMAGVDHLAMSVPMLMLSFGCFAYGVRPAAPRGAHYVRRTIVVAAGGAAMVLWHLVGVHWLGIGGSPSSMNPIADLLMHAGVSLGAAMFGLALLGLVASCEDTRR